MFALIVVLSLATGGLSSILCPTKVDPQLTVHLPHPTSCSKFLTCVGNHPVEQDCPAGLHWNVEQSYCDYPRESQCSRGVLDPSPFNSSAVANSVCLPQTSQCPLNANPSERVIFLKHRDCRKFYACVSTQQVELSCPPKLYWNSRSCVCDYEADTECDDESDRVEEQVPEEADGEQREPEEEVEEQGPVVEGGEGAPEDAVPGDKEDQEPAQENADGGAQGDFWPYRTTEVYEQEDIDAVIPRVRRAADGDSSNSGSTTTVSDASGTGSSGSGSSGSGSSGSGSSSSGSGSSGSPVQSGADVRAVSSIAMIAFTAAMSVL